MGAVIISYSTLGDGVAVGNGVAVGIGTGVAVGTGAGSVGDSFFPHAVIINPDMQTTANTRSKVLFILNLPVLRPDGDVEYNWITLK